jgi:hypothetical protein
VDSDHNGLINYHEFSRAFKITDVKEMKHRGDGHHGNRGEDPGWADRIIQQMSNFLFQYRLELASMFRAFDVNNDGTISRQEFKVREPRRHHPCLHWLCGTTNDSKAPCLGADGWSVLLSVVRVLLCFRRMGS